MDGDSIQPVQPAPKKRPSFFGLIEFGAGGMLIGLAVFIFALLALNYLNILSLSKMNPKLFSLLPTSVPVPGSCKVVEEKFCPKAEVLELDTNGQTIRFIGLNLPPGTPIFAPSSNELTKTEIKDGSIKGFQGSLSGGFDSDSTPPFLLYGDIKFNNMLTEDVEKGSLIGHIQDTGIENFGYNFLINLGSKGPDDKDADSRKTKFLGEMFPEAFEKSK